MPKVTDRWKKLGSSFCLRWFRLMSKNASRSVGANIFDLHSQLFEGSFVTYHLQVPRVSMPPLSTTILSLHLHNFKFHHLRKWHEKYGKVCFPEAKDSFPNEPNYIQICFLFQLWTFIICKLYNFTVYTHNLKFYIINVFSSTTAIDCHYLSRQLDFFCLKIKRDT